MPPPPQHTMLQLKAGVEQGPVLLCHVRVHEWAMTSVPNVQCLTLT